MCGKWMCATDEKEMYEKPIFYEFLASFSVVWVGLQFLNFEFWCKLTQPDDRKTAQKFEKKVCAKIIFGIISFEILKKYRFRLLLFMTTRRLSDKFILQIILK